MLFMHVIGETGKLNRRPKPWTSNHQHPDLTKDLRSLCLIEGLQVYTQIDHIQTQWLQKD
jgi:hypothetical protein